MVSITATEARNNIKKLWCAASKEPVTVQSAGKPIAVVMSPEEYDKLTAVKKPRKAGFLKEMFEGVDVDAIMAISLDDMFAEYMP